jgi:hypothetical protein
VPGCTGEKTTRPPGARSNVACIGRTGRWSRRVSAGPVRRPQWTTDLSSLGSGCREGSRAACRRPSNDANGPGAERSEAAIAVPEAPTAPCLHGAPFGRKASSGPGGTDAGEALERRRPRTFSTCRRKRVLPTGRMGGDKSEELLRTCRSEPSNLRHEFHRSRFDANTHRSVRRGRKNLVIHVDIHRSLKCHLPGALRCQRRRVVASFE